MARFSHTINMAIFWLFLLLAIVLSLANWGIILFSIVDTVIIHSAKGHLSLQDMGCVSNIRSHIVSRFFLSNNV